MRFKYLIVSIAICFMASMALSHPCFSGELSAYQIMKKSEALTDQAKDSKAEMTITLINKKGKERQRKLLAYMKNYDNGEDKTLIIFISPADVKGTSFLAWSAPGKEDKQWLYLPALQRVRQISSSGKGESFMGTEFSFYDMGSHHIDDNTYTLLKEEEVEGHMCYVIEAMPKDMKYYSKVISWIRKDNFIPIKVDFYDKKGKYLKQAISTKIENIKGINTPTHIKMHNVQNNRTTIIEFANILYDTGLNDDIFTQRYMQRGK
ncbi:MAG: outer membrane lipoprotein-sorting protein [Deltaproteobacteria bacterium]|nr:outer membrane lipoprotein-sorting protein [Deltaproteobacteria bacterium]